MRTLRVPRGASAVLSPPKPFRFPVLAYSTALYSMYFISAVFLPFPRRMKAQRQAARQREKEAKAARRAEAQERKKAELAAMSEEQKAALKEEHKVGAGGVRRRQGRCQ